MTSHRSRTWCFTTNNPAEFEKTHDPLPLWKGLKYRIFSYEIGANGTPHFQGYCAFENAKTFDQMQKLIPLSHLSVAKGNSRQNFDYTTKDPIAGPWEYGERPLTSKEKGNLEKDRWSDMISLAETSNLDELKLRYPKEYVLHKGKWEAFALENKCVTSLPAFDNEWRYGPTGTGKSFPFVDRPGEVYEKSLDHYWEVYKDEPIVLLEEFGMEHRDLGNLLKRWADKYPFRGNVKYSSCYIRPARIIVTSNYHPQDIWSDSRMLDPILRRFKLVHLTEKWET